MPKKHREIPSLSFWHECTAEESNQIGPGRSEDCCQNNSINWIEINESDAQKLYDYLLRKANGMYTTKDEAKELVKMMEGK